MVTRVPVMRICIIAGEPSGDKLGGALMSGLKSLMPDIEFTGIGGAQMHAEGLESLFPMNELSVMGIAEVLPKYRALMARIKQTSQFVIDSKPDVLITIDSPDFSFRVAKRVKAASAVRTVHYVAPTVWAWRPGRAEKISKYIDHLLTLFPFEPPYFTKHGMDCDFVGHPVVAEPIATGEDVQAFRERLDIKDDPLMLVLPGSRRGEIARLSEVFGHAVERVVAQHPRLKVVVPAAAPVADDVLKAVADWSIELFVLDPRNHDLEDARFLKASAFRAADIALAASGTVSLELAAAETPMVIAYRMHWLSYRLIRYMALVDTVTLVNLVSETRVVPEFLGPACEPAPIAEALDLALKSPDQQLAAMQQTMLRLGKGKEAPGVRAARAILSRL